MHIGDLIRFKKNGALGVIIRVQEAFQVDDPMYHVVWVGNGKRGACWWDEVDVLSRGGKQ